LLQLFHYSVKLRCVYNIVMLLCEKTYVQVDPYCLWRIILMIKKYQLVVSLILCLLMLSAIISYAVEEFKISEYGNGKQIWFEAEHFDERDSENVYKLGIAEDAKEPTEGAYGDIVTNVGGDGWLRYNFDISHAGGEAGDWRFIGRVINPNNQSDWLWVLGDDGDEIPKAKPGHFQKNVEIIFEENTPNWAWVRTGIFGADGGTVNKLQDGENVMIIYTRQSAILVQYDVFLWSSDLDYEPTDEDYDNATTPNLPVNPKGLLTTTWGNLKNR